MLEIHHSGQEHSIYIYIYIYNIYILRRSGLIMEVHPGCPVCLIVAASLVDLETDVGEIISAAKVAV